MFTLQSECSSQKVNAHDAKGMLTELSKYIHFFYYFHLQMIGYSTLSQVHLIYYHSLCKVNSLYLSKPTPEFLAHIMAKHCHIYYSM